MSQTIVFNTIPFSLKSISQINENSLLVSFTNEPLAINPVNTNDGLNPNNYTLNGPAVNNIISVNTVAADPRSLILNIKVALITGTWTLTVSNVQDVDSLTISAPNSQSFVADYSDSQPALSQGADTQDVVAVLLEHLTPLFKGKPGWDALISSIATGDDYLSTLSQQAYDQLFLSSASGKYLNIRASDYGFNKPVGVGISDEDFRNLVINLNSDKITLPSFLKILEIYYGQDAVRAHIDSGIETYNLDIGDTLDIVVDNVNVTVVFKDSDSTILNNTQAVEAASAITRAFENQKLNAYARPVFDPASGKSFVRIYSGSLGLKGRIAITGGTANSVFQFPENKIFTLNSQTRTAMAVQPNTNTECDVILPTTTQIITRSAGLAAYPYANPKINIIGPIAVSSISSNGSEVTVTTSTSHNLLPNNTFFLGPGTSDFLPGIKTIVSVPDNNTIVYSEVTDIATNNDLNYVCPSYRNDGLVTLTTTTSHGLQTGQFVIIDNLIAKVGIQSFIGIYSTLSTGNATDYAALALLQNGNVLSIGGGTASPNNVLLIDPLNSTISSLTNLTYNCYQGTATTLQNGQVLIVDGNTDNIPVAQIYDPTTNLILNTNPLTVHRQAHTATLLPNGTVLVVGGKDFAGNPLNSVEIYNPESSTWSSGPSLSLARFSHTATLLPNGTVLVVGGETGSASTSCEIYNPNNNTWHTVLSSSQWRKLHTATLLNNGNVLLIGGLDYSGIALDSTEVYKDATESFSAVSTIPSVIYDQAAAKIDNGNVVVFGGKNATLDLDTIYIYNPVQDVWQQSSYNLTSARSRLSAILLNSGDVFVTNGDGHPFDIYNNEKKVFSSGQVNGIFKITNTGANSLTYSTLNITDSSVLEELDPTSGAIQPFKAKSTNYPGPYILDPKNSYSAITSKSCILTQGIEANRSYSILNVNDCSQLDDSGYLILNFGYKKQIGPVKFISKISNTQLAIDSSFIFPLSVDSGSNILQLSQLGSFQPTHPEKEGLFYLTDSASGRIAASDTIDKASATGIVVNKIVKYPGTIGLGNGDISTDSAGPKINDGVYIWGSEEEIRSKRGY